MTQKITAVYFSPTGNSKKTALAIAEGIASDVHEMDITVEGMERTFGKEDFVVVGMPVYAGRIPAVAAERLPLLKGNETNCIIAASYGNREFDDALLEMADMLREQGFVIKGAAGVIGRHTYGEIQMERPDENDLAESREFGAKAAASEKVWPEFEIPGNRPYREGAGKGKFHPITAENCVKCGLCVRNCPVNAIAEDCMSVGDECISCFRCIRSCPLTAKHMDTEAYNKFAAEFTEKLKVRKENTFFL